MVDIMGKQIKLVVLDFDDTINDPNKGEKLGQFYHPQQLQEFAQSSLVQGQGIAIVTVGSNERIKTSLNATFPDRDFLNDQDIYGIEVIVDRDPDSKRFTGSITKAHVIELAIDDYNKNHPNEDPITMSNILFADDDTSNRNAVGNAGALVYHFDKPDSKYFMTGLKCAANHPELYEGLYDFLESMGKDDNLNTIKSDTVKKQLKDTANIAEPVERLMTIRKQMPKLHYKTKGSVADYISKIGKSIKGERYDDAYDKLQALSAKLQARAGQSQLAKSSSKSSNPEPKAKF